MTTGRGRSGPEWVTFGVSLVVLGVVVAGLAVQIAAGDDPPRPVSTAGAALAHSDGTFHVPVDVHNHGDRAAAEVQVTSALTLDGVTVEGDQTIDFLGAGETESLVFVFATDPRDGELDIAVSGFAVP